MSKPIKTYSDKAQIIWETWFVISCTLVAVAFVLGISFSQQDFPSYPYWLVLSIINFGYCLYKGTKVN